MTDKDKGEFIDVEYDPKTGKALFVFQESYGGFNVSFPMDLRQLGELKEQIEIAMSEMEEVSDE